MEVEMPETAEDLRWLLEKTIVKKEATIVCDVVQVLANARW